MKSGHDMLKYLQLNKKHRINPTQTVVLGFAIIIILGALLLTLPVASRSGQSTGFIDALFTATSAVCVTGLVVFDTYLYWSLFGQVVILVLIQVGGLGFMTVATLFSLMIGRRISYKERLVIVESLNQQDLQGVIRMVKRILLGTLIFESLGAIILSTRFVPEFGLASGIYKAVFHAVSSFCNAGFDLMGQNGEFSGLTGYVADPLVNLVIMFLIVIGGLGFIVWEDVYQTRSLKKLHLHTKLVLTVTGILLLFGFLFFLVMEYHNPNTMGPLDMKGKLLASVFQSVTPRTAGFNTINIADLTNASIFVTVFLMFIGGSPGSTAGGIKTATAGVLFFAVSSVIRGKDDTELFNRRVHQDTVMQALAITFISALLIAVVTIILSVFEDGSLAAELFETVSAFGTVGLSMGLTPGLHIVSKTALIVTMFLGRVGVLTMAWALAYRLEKKQNYRYPEDRVMVG